MYPTNQIIKVFYSQAEYLNREWTTFEQLFMFSEARSKLLYDNRISEFTDTIKFSLIYDIEMTISRLTDQTKKNGNPNLTVESFVEQVCNNVDKTINEKDQEKRKNRITRLWKRLPKLVHEIRKFRNKSIAHLDLKVACGDKAPSLSRLRTIKKAVEVIRIIAEEGLALATGKMRSIKNQRIERATRWVHGCLQFGSERPSEMLRVMDKKAVTNAVN